MISENQTYCNNPLNVVRIFLDHDYSYGLWINEHFLYCHLDREQQKLYTNRNDEFEIDIDIARVLLKEGKTGINRVSVTSVTV